MADEEVKMAGQNDRAAVVVESIPLLLVGPRINRRFARATRRDLLLPRTNLRDAAVLDDLT